MENKSRLKLFLLIISVLVVFATSIWLLLHSSLTANNSVVIKTRNFYYLKLLPVWGFDKQDLNYTIFPMSKDPKYGYYTYSLLGKFEKFDFDDSLIYLTDRKGKTFAIRYFIKRSAERSDQVFFEYQNFDSKSTPTQNTVIIDVFQKENTVTKFIKGDLIEIQWQDFRILNQVLSNDMTSNETIIERDGVVTKGVTQVINIYLYEN